MISPPAHGGQVRQVALAYGLDPEAILDFSANINPEGPSPEVMAALRRSVEDPGTLACYPDLQLTDLRTAIVNHLGKARASSDEAASEPTEPTGPAGLALGNIAVANGFVPLLEAAVRAFDLKRTLLPVPAFGEYRETLRRCRATVIPHPLNLGDFCYNPERLARELDAAAADSLLLANPQNPSGVLTPARTILQLARSRPHVTMLLDEAFIDYVPHESVIPHLNTCPNLVVFRSVTKFFAMPGLRVAYATGNVENMSKLREELAPWPVSTIAADAAIAALRSPGTGRSIELNRERRGNLVRQLVELGITCPEASANFLLLRMPRAVPNLWERLLLEHALLLRRCDNFESIEADVLRTAVRDEPDNDRLVAALAACLGAS